MINPEVAKLENKEICIGDNSYRLTITKKRNFRDRKNSYIAYLSSVSSQFSINKIFTDINELEKGLRAWIIKADMLNNPESAVFQQLEDWDGVIEI